METAAERRRRKLGALCKREGGVTKVALHAEVSPAALDQILKGVLLPLKKDGTRSARALGDPAARAIEDAFDLGRGWFDTPEKTALDAGRNAEVSADVPSGTPQEIQLSAPFSAVNLSHSILLLGSLLGALDRRSRRILGALLADLAESPDDAEDIAHKATAVATVQKRITRDPGLSKAIRGRGDAVETSHGALHE